MGVDKREKVIKGLETSLSIGVCGKCVNECWYGDTIASCHDIIQYAIALLKAQEPKKPIVSGKRYGNYLEHCPSCGILLPISSDYGKSYYCYKCGQAVKW